MAVIKETKNGVWPAHNAQTDEIRAPHIGGHTGQKTTKARGDSHQAEYENAKVEQASDNPSREPKRQVIRSRNQRRGTHSQPPISA